LAPLVAVLERIGEAVAACTQALTQRADGSSGD
jgi:hypothetical protein